MKNKIFVLCAILALTATACSDGMTPKMPELAASTSCDVVLQAYKVGADPSTAKAGDIAITAGEGVVLSWSASNLTSATLTSDPPEVVGQPVVLAVTDKKEEKSKAPELTKGADAPAPIKVSEGSQEFRALTHNVSFTVTAKNEEKGKKETECKGHLNVAVSAEPAKLTINKFDATPSEIAVGGTSQLCWDVTPDTATIAIVDSDGNALAPQASAPAEEPPSSEAKMMLPSGLSISLNKAEEAPAVTETAPAGFKAKDCVTVTPAKETSYTLTATTADGQKLTGNAKVSIAQTQVNVLSFLANGQAILILDKAGEVRLSWEVSPETATVSIDNGVGDVGAKGDQTVTVNESTTFTLTAKVGDQIDTKQVSVTIQPAAINGQFTVKTSGDQMIFAGEEAVLSWTVGTTLGEVPSDVAVTIKGGQFGAEGTPRLGATVGSEKVKPTATTEYIIEASRNGYVSASQTIRVVVRMFTGPEAPKGSNVSAVGIDPKGVEKVIIGYKANLSKSAGKDGFIFLSAGSGNPPVWTDIPFGFLDAFQETGDYAGMWNMDFFADLGAYPVNVIAYDPADSNHIFAGMAGGILESSNGGRSFSMLDKAYIANYDGYAGTHPSCKGYEQKGKTGNRVVSVEQICDIAISETGRMFVASDHKLAYLPNGAGALAAKADDKANWWVVDKGASYGKPNYDLEIAKPGDAEVLVIANADGVSVSSDMGATISALAGAPAGKAYSLAFDKASSTLFAGADGGVNVCSGFDGSSCGNWTNSAISGKVISMAVEQVGGLSLIYAGTDAGIFVSRDDGKTFTDITPSAMAKAAVNKVSVMTIGNDTAVYAATSSGLFGSVVLGNLSLQNILRPAPIQPVVPSPVPASDTMKKLF